MSSTCVIASFTTLYLSLGSLFSHQKAPKEKKLENQFIGPLSLKSISFCFPIKLCFKGHKWRVIVCHLRFYGSLVRPQITIRCVVDLRLWSQRKISIFCEKYKRNPVGSQDRFMVTLKYLLGEKGSAIKCFARAFRTGLIFNAKLRLMPCLDNWKIKPLYRAKIILS